MEKYLSVTAIEYVSSKGSNHKSQKEQTKGSYTLLLVLKGTAVFKRNNTRYSLSSGQMICCRPFDIYSYIADEAAKLYIVQFCAEGDGLELLTQGMCTLPEESLPAFERFYNFINDKFHTNDFLPTYIKKNTPSKANVQLAFNLLEHAFLISLDNMIISEPNDGKIFVDYSPEVKTFMNVVINHLEEWLTAPDLAALCNMSLSNLKKHLAEFFPEGVKTFFMKEKISYASKLLLDGMSVAKVSEKLSFPTTYYFSTVFKRFTGMSPTQYKKAKTDEGKSSSKKETLKINKDKLETK